MGGTARLLIVDDAEDVRLLYTEILAREYECETANDGEEALQRLRATPFDALILDLTMPVMDGWAVLEELRTDTRLQHLPTIVLSADFDDATELRARSLGAAAYVAKPVAHDDLVYVVERALKGETPGTH